MATERTLELFLRARSLTDRLIPDLPHRILGDQSLLSPPIGTSLNSPRSHWQLFTCDRHVGVGHRSKLEHLRSSSIRSENQRRYSQALYTPSRSIGDHRGPSTGQACSNIAMRGIVVFSFTRFSHFSRIDYSAGATQSYLLVGTITAFRLAGASGGRLLRSGKTSYVPRPTDFLYISCTG